MKKEDFNIGLSMDRLKNQIKKETLPKFEIQGKYYEGRYYVCSHCLRSSVGASGVDVWICNNCGVKNMEFGERK